MEPQSDTFETVAYKAVPCSEPWLIQNPRHVKRSSNISDDHAYSENSQNSFSSILMYTQPHSQAHH